MVSTESTLPPQFATFSTSSARAPRVFLSTPPADSFLAVQNETVEVTRAITKKPDVAVDTINFNARRSEQVRGHTVTGT